MTRVAVYTRISVDPGAQTATARQAEACLEFAAARNWRVTETFEDVDVSAYQPRANRPAYEQLRQTVGSGAIDGVLVWKLDRLVRRPAEFERFWAACETGKTFLASVTEPIDSSTDFGLAMVRVLSVFAGLESSTIGLRISAKRRQEAEQGTRPGGPKPFGLTADWETIVPAEAALIREGAARVLSGESLRSIVRSWNAAGERRPRGGPWTGTHLSALLRHPRLVGDRTWKRGGEIVAADCFPAILDRLTQARVRHVLAERAGRHPGETRRFLLSGILRCGVCGHPMYGRKTVHGHLNYACTPVGGCGRISVGGISADDWATAKILNRNHTPRRSRPEAALGTALHEGAACLERLNSDYYVHHLLERGEYLQARAEILGVTARELAGHPGLVAEGLPQRFDLRYIRSSWPALSTLQRRAVISSQAEQIVVASVGSKGGMFNSSRLSITWRSELSLNARDTSGPRARATRSPL